MKYKKNCRLTESGVSELIGALVLISMIVLVVAVIAAGMISRPSTEKVPQVRFSVVNSSSIGGSYSVSITHDGGDEIPDSEYAVFNNGIQINNITVSPSNSGTTWSIGKTLIVNTGILEPGQISVYYYGKTVNNPTLLGQRILGNATTTATATIPTTTTTTSPTPTPCQPPVASFTVNLTNGCTPLTVQFTDTSTGTPTSWNWNFGDSGTSTIQSPIHTYTSAGNYTVTLISGNTCGSNTSTRTGLVQSYGNIPAPVSEAGGFWYLNEGSGTSVSDSSGHGNTGAITSGKWVNCPSPGRGYLIFNGNSAYVSIPNTASLTPTNQVSFEAWVYPVVQKTAKVIQKRDWDGHGIDQDTWQGWQGGVTLSDGTKHDVTWSPGGGNLQPALQTWYYVVLTYDGAALRIYVNGVERNSIPLTGTLRQFSAPVIIGSTTSQKYFNGSISNVAMYSRALSKCEIAARYASFTPQGCVPVTNFVATPTTGIPPLTVQFTDTSTGSPASWNWNFGDGTTSTLQNPSHTYTAIGDYTVSLTTTNGFGSNSATKVNYIQVAKKSFVDYVIDDNVFIYGNKLDFAGNTMSGPGATIVITGPLTTRDLNGGAAVEVSTIYIGGNVNLDEGSAGLGSESKPGAIYVNGDLYLGKGARDIYGDVYVARNFYLKDAHINGNVYVNGDLTLDWTPKLAEKARIYYTGKFTYPPTMSKEIIDKCIYQEKVPGFSMPDQAIPPVKPTEWYDKRGYLPGGDLTSGIKIFTSSYSSTKSKNTAENVVIVAYKGDITITGLGGNGVTGVLFAPYGKVTFEGEFFEGVVIARDGFFVTRGGTEVTFVNFAKYFSSPDDYPL